MFGNSGNIIFLMPVLLDNIRVSGVSASGNISGNTVGMGGNILEESFNDLTIKDSSRYRTEGRP
jgi:hypothetical protein